MLDNANDATSKFIQPDIYFTAKGNVVHIFARSWKDTEVQVKTLAAGNQKIKNITLLGSPDKLIWRQNAAGLNITMPIHLPKSVPVYVFKVTCVN